MGLIALVYCHPGLACVQAHMPPIQPTDQPCPRKENHQSHTYTPELFRAQLLRDVLQVLSGLDIKHLANLACIAHQLFGAGIEHAHFAVASDGEIVK